MSKECFIDKLRRETEKEEFKKALGIVCNSCWEIRRGADLYVSTEVEPSVICPRVIWRGGGGDEISNNQD